MTGFWRSSLDPEHVMSTYVTRWQDDEWGQREEHLTVEEPLEIRLGGHSLAVIMRTPGYDDELAAGFLLSEGVIQDAGEILEVRPACDDDGLPQANVVEVTLREQSMSEAATSAFQRHFAVSASCGLCGKDSIAAVLSASEPLMEDASHFRVPAVCLYELPARLREAQAVFTHTGGLHAAGLFNVRGELLLLREDVGRHNAVDKLIGHGVLHATLPYSRSILLVSGRTSFEIIQKALRARIPCIAAISAPSSLAVELAEQGGITLIGFLRGRTMNVYTHPERITENGSESSVHS
ncbi:MAG TPA: formate dehydrogenase accessory sulfurtransferase FdhD [Ktedonobacteraceae bacterium]|jgi:FdhD protein|nr:formate dehydrogenase accessory sulfurtransferase FdhD [Ktedonobacteraceae bacterium]